MNDADQRPMARGAMQPGPAPAEEGFSERAFYLREFRGRSLGLALPSAPVGDPDGIRDVLDAFDGNETTALLLGADAGVLGQLGVEQPIDASGPEWLAGLRRVQKRGGRLGLLVSDEAELLAACGHAAERLRLAKIVWIDEDAPLQRAGRGVVSFVGPRELRAWVADAPAQDPALAGFLRGVARMIEAGLPSLAVTPSARLGQELFTFGGAGTLFARERYVDVRWLGLDEFDAAAELVRRGVAEGYLVERSEAELERVLANAFGVFVEGRYLAGIGALLPHPGTGMGEIASLYTLTRFVREGVGAHLLRFAVGRAQAAGSRGVFACTTSEQVVRFFERNGFERAPPEAVPPGKWKEYSPERRARVQCLVKRLSPRSGHDSPSEGREGEA